MAWPKDWLKTRDGSHDPDDSPLMYVAGGRQPRKSKPHRNSGYVLRMRKRCKTGTRATTTK